MTQESGQIHVAQRAKVLHKGSPHARAGRLSQAAQNHFAAHPVELDLAARWQIWKAFLRLIGQAAVARIDERSQLRVEAEPSVLLTDQIDDRERRLVLVLS